MDIEQLQTSRSEGEAVSKVGRNFFWMVCSSVAGIANSVVLWVFLARVWELEELGRFTIVMGLYGLVLSISALGMMPYFVSEISRIKERDEPNDDRIGSLTGSSVVFVTLAGVASAAAIILLGLWASGSTDVRIAVLILSISMLPSGLITFFESAAIAHGRTRLIAAVATLENLIRTIVPIGLILSGFGLYSICIVFVAVRFVSVGIYALAASDLLERITFRWAEFKSIFRVAPTFAGTVILASILWQASAVLLGYFSSDAEAAKYGVASRFLIPISIIMASYAGVIQPLLARYAESESGNAGAYLARAIRYPFIIALAGAIASPFFSEQVITAMFGAKHAGASVTTDTLALCAVPFCIVMVAARGLVAIKAQHIDLIANAIGVCVFVASALFLIPTYGAVGAATSQLLAFMVMAAIELVYLSRRIAGFQLLRSQVDSVSGFAFAHRINWKR